MSTNVFNSTGNLVTSIPDNSIDTTSTSLQLIGLGAQNIVEGFNENLVRITENWCNGTPPLNPIVGQGWWNNAANAFSIWDGQEWTEVGGSATDTVAQGMAQNASDLANAALDAATISAAQVASLVAANDTQIGLATQGALDAANSAISDANTYAASAFSQVSTAVTQANAALVAIAAEVLNRQNVDGVIMANVTNLESSLGNTIAQVATINATISFANGSSQAAQITALSAGANATNAVINTNLLAQQANGASLAGMIVNLGAQIAGANAALSTSEVTQAANASAISGRIDTLTANTANLAAQIVTNQAAQVANGAALAAEQVILTSMVNGANSAITIESTTRASNAAALAGQLVTIGAQIAGANATITANQILNVSNAAALAGQLVTIGAQIAGANATVTNNQIINVSNAAALAASITGLTASLGSTNSTVSSNYSVYQTNAASLASSILNLGSQIAGVNATITANNQTYTSNAASLASSISTLNANTVSQQALIVNNQNIFLSNAATLAQQISTTNSQLAAANATIVTVQNALTMANSASANSISIVTAGLNSANTTISNLSTTVTNNQSTTASQVSLLQAQVFPGHNRLVNGDFSLGFQGWSGMTTGATPYINSTYGLLADLGTSTSVFSVNSNPIPLTPGVTYTLSGNIGDQSSGPSSSYMDRIYYYANGVSILDGGQTISSHALSLNGQPNYIYTETAPAGTDHCIVRVVIDNTGSNSVTGYAQNLKLEIGNIATPSTPESATIQSFNQSVIANNVATASSLTTLGSQIAGANAVITANQTATASALSSLTTTTNTLTARLNPQFGVNLLVNPSFQQGAVGWTINYGSPYTYAAFGTAEQYYPGTGNLGYNYRAVAQSAPFNVQASFPYVWQLTAYSGGIGASTTFHRAIINWYNSSGTLLSQQVLWQTNIASGWTKYYCDATNTNGLTGVTAPSTATSASIVLDIASSSGNIIGSGDGFIWGSLKFEVGTYCTPFTDSQLAATVASQASALATAQSAISTNNSTLTAAINSTNATVSTQATAIANATGQLYGNYVIQASAGGVVTGLSLTSANGPTPISTFAVNATDFVLTNSSSGARLVMSNQLIQIYDSSGTLRVKLGIF